MTKQIATILPNNTSRRGFLRQVAATTALLVAAHRLLPSGAYAAPAAPK